MVKRTEGSRVFRFIRQDHTESTCVVLHRDVGGKGITLENGDPSGCGGILTKWSKHNVPVVYRSNAGILKHVDRRL